MDTALNKLTLKQARLVLGLSLREAGALVGVTKNTLDRYEQPHSSCSARAMHRKRELSRHYMALAREKGYDPSLFHESRLCPGEYPEPACASLNMATGPVE